MMPEADLLCTYRWSVTRARLDPGAHGRRDALRRAEIAGLHGEADAGEEGARVGKTSYDAAGCQHLCRCRRQDHEDGDVVRQELCNTLVEPALARRQIARLMKCHHPADLARIEVAEARAARAERKIDYYSESGKCMNGRAGIY